DTGFGPHVLAIDADAEARRIARALEDQVVRRLRRRGLVVALSGGVDSSVVAALSTLALGAGRVFALFLPERHASPESLVLGRRMADGLGLASEVVSIDPILEAAGCYREQDAAIRAVLPDYGEGWRSKIVVPPLREGDRL